MKNSIIFHRWEVEDIDGGLKDKGKAKSIQSKYRKWEGTRTLATTHTTRSLDPVPLPGEEREGVGQAKVIYASPRRPQNTHESLKPYTMISFEVWKPLITRGIVCFPILVLGDGVEPEI